MGLFPRVVDADLDGRKDLLVGEAEGTLRLYRNVNTDDDPSFDGGTLLTVGPPDMKAVIDVGQRPTPFVLDWDGDGRRDLLVGSKDGYLWLFINEGTDAAWDFRSAQFVQEDGADMIVPGLRPSPHVIDIDGDGVRDLLVGNTEGQILLYRNQGADDSPLFSGYELVSSEGVPIDLAGIPRSRPFVCDWNNDGELDLLVGSGDGLVRLYAGICECGTSGTIPQLASATRLLPPYPNPFNPTVTIPFELSAPRRVRLGVYDSAGRLAALLADRLYPAGSHEIAWRGISGYGTPLPSGVYFIRFEAGGGVSTRKAVLLR